MVKIPWRERVRALSRIGICLLEVIVEFITLIKVRSEVLIVVAFLVKMRG